MKLIKLPDGNYINKEKVISIELEEPEIQEKTWGADKIPEHRLHERSVIRVSSDSGTPNRCYSFKGDRREELATIINE